MASIGIGTIGGSFAMAQGWKLVQDLANYKTQYGLFDKNGNPFYETALGSPASNTPPSPSTTLGGKAIDAVSGALDKFSKSLSSQVNVEVGVLGVNTTCSAEITQAPIEQGQFFAYNKRQNAIQGQVQYIVTGTEKQRNIFVRAAQKAQASLELFSLYVDEIFIPNMNIVGVASERNAKSTQMFIVTLSVQEARNTAKTTNPLANATAYSGTAVDRGELQTQSATGAQEQIAKRRQP